MEKVFLEGVKGNVSPHVGGVPASENATGLQDFPSTFPVGLPGLRKKAMEKGDNSSIPIEDYLGLKFTRMLLISERFVIPVCS